MTSSLLLKTWGAGWLTAAMLFLPATASEAQVERRLERTFKVDANSVVAVRMGGGPIQVTTGPSGSATLRIEQRVDVASERDADEQLKDYEIAISEDRGRIMVIGRRLRQLDDGWRWSRRERVRLAAVLTVPANVRLDLNTSGGSIMVRGDRTAPIAADTSGGSIDVDGGRAEMTLDTSGGSIQVGRALSMLRADTSGGHITVRYVGPEAREVVVETSGGGIDIGVDPGAKLSLRASTSGGSVNVRDLSVSTTSVSRTRIVGDMNGGGGRLSADTSGGTVTLHSARGN